MDLRPTALLLMALLVAAIVDCGATKHQINTYEECMSRCNHQLEHCVLKCNDRAWKWSDGQIMECVKQCDQKKAECEQLCSRVEGKNY